MLQQLQLLVDKFTLIHVVTRVAVTQSCMWLDSYIKLQFTCGYLELHRITCGYLESLVVTYSYTRLHVVT